MTEESPHYCTVCGPETPLLRSRVRFYELPLRLFFIIPLRCHDCSRRYFRLVFPAALARIPRKASQ